MTTSGRINDHTGAQKKRRYPTKNLGDENNNKKLQYNVKTLSRYEIRLFILEIVKYRAAQRNKPLALPPLTTVTG